jgi:hypothetical protein
VVFKYRQPLSKLIKFCGLIREIQGNVGGRDVFKVKPVWFNLAKVPQAPTQAPGRPLSNDT